VSRRSSTRTSRARVRFYNEAERDVVTIIVNCVLPRWLTRYIIATILLEFTCAGLGVILLNDRIVSSRARVLH
jgi:hypothetical protein